MMSSKYVIHPETFQLSVISKVALVTVKPITQSLKCYLYPQPRETKIVKKVMV